MELMVAWQVKEEDVAAEAGQDSEEVPVKLKGAMAVEFRFSARFAMESENAKLSVAALGPT